jgi:hypothetical protein
MVAAVTHGYLRRRGELVAAALLVSRVSGGCGLSNALSGAETALTSGGGSGKIGTDDMS